MSNTDSGSAPDGTTIVNQSGGVSVEAETVNVGGDLIARDKIVNNVTSIYQRALTAAEEARQAHSIETEYLARGVSVYAERLRTNVTKTDDRGGPYKGLLEYRLSDAEIFFGRERAIGEALQHLDRNPLTVLHSESGTGKTSLLQAGVSARLIVNGHLPIYCRPYDVSPAQSIKQALLPNLSQTPGLSGASLRDFLWQVCNVLGANTTLYILLDQFEEFFLHLDEAQRAIFVRELAECLNDASLNVRWLLALRSEFFGQLANFRPRISNPFENDYRLNRLTRDEAEAVIAKPADRYGVSFEAGLIDTLLDDLGQTDITPPQIQLVCSALYGELGDAKTITRELYEREGGAAGILRGHLERVLNRVPATQRPAARQLLEALISSEPRRVIRTRADLVAELHKLGITSEVFDTVLDQLIQSRLIRVEGESADASEVSYELAHDYLLDEIKLDPTVQARKAAQELLDREVQSYQRYRTLLSDDKLAILQPRRGELVISDESRALLDKSERAFRRRRGLVFGGVGLVIALIIIGVIASVTAIGAQSSAQNSQRLQATSEAGAAMADMRSANAERQLGEAMALQATSEAAAATATVREAVANQALQQAFKQTGVVPVGHAPSALAFVGSQLWVANAQDDTLQAIESSTGAIVKTINVGAGPIALTFDGKQLWVANHDDSTVQPIDHKTGQAGEPIHVITGPHGLAFGGQRLWVIGRDDQTSDAPVMLQSIDPATGQTGEPLRLKSDLPFALTYDGQRLWAGETDLAAFNPDTGTRIGQVSVQIIGGEYPLTSLSDGQRLWVATFDNHSTVLLLRIDPASGSADPVFTDSVSDPAAKTRRSSPIGLAYDGTRVWLANRSTNTVWAIDPDTAMASAPLQVGIGPVAMAFGNRRLWVANQDDNTVQAIDPMSVPSAPLAVGDQPQALLVAQSRLWVAGNTTVRALSLTGGKLSAPEWSEAVPVGEGHPLMTYDGQRLWVAHLDDSLLQAIDPIRPAVVVTTTVRAGIQALTFDRKQLWIATYDRTSGQNSLQVLDPDSRTVHPITPLDGLVGTMMFDGQDLWLAFDNVVQKVDPATGAVSEPIAVGVYNNALAFADQHLWVATQLGTTTAGYVVKLVEQPTGEWLESDVGGNTPAALTPDGRRMWVAYKTGNVVQALDLISARHLITVPVGKAPRALAFDGKRVWIANSEDGTVQAIYPTD